MDMRSKQYVEWIYDTALTSGATVNIEVALSGHGVTRVIATDTVFLTWGIVTSHAATFTLLGSLRPAWPATDTILTLAVLAGVYTTPYDLPGPLNNTGSVVLTRPFISLRLADAAVANHTYTRFYAKAWW